VIFRFFGQDTVGVYESVSHVEDIFVKGFLVKCKGFYCDDFDKDDFDKM
jgi:hypothetical protein